MVLQKILDIDCLCLTHQVFQMTKTEQICKKYGMLSLKIAESEKQSPGNCQIGSNGSIYNKDTIQTDHSAFFLPSTHNDRPRNQNEIGLKFLKPQLSQHYPSRTSFIKPDWKITHDINLF
jgi:hypothetical protein